MLLLLWKRTTEAAAMPKEGEDCGPPAAQEDVPATHYLSEHCPSTAPTSTPKEETLPQTTKTLDPEVQQTPSEGTSEAPSQSTQKASKCKVPMVRPGPVSRRERLKFILGASEDNSSDEELLATRPPSGTSQPPAKPPPQQAPAEVPQTSSSRMK